MARLAASDQTTETSGAGGIGPVTVIANEKSGTNARDSQAIRRAMEVFEGSAEAVTLVHWSPEDDLNALIDRAEAQGARLIIAAGGDGTVMAVAGAMVGRDSAMGVLPLGTFNYFSRGLGLSEDPAEAARALLAGRPRAIAVASVNGQVFLNNASLGIYPAILKMRESIYARWGRYRLMAHWSVIKTFLRFQRPMHLRLTTGGVPMDRRTPLLFVARSAYQLDSFGLKGERAIENDELAVLVGKGETRAELFKLAWRLVTRTMQEGRDYELISTRALQVETGPGRTLVAFDGEKRRERSPFEFTMESRPLRILLPPESAEAHAGERDAEGRLTGGEEEPALAARTSVPEGVPEGVAGERPA